MFRDAVSSTQDVAADLIARGAEPLPGVIFASHQTHGRGRFDRTWLSAENESLTMSLLYPCYRDHKSPWLIGMAVAAAAAEALDCRLQWPNDLVLNGKKVGGILTELVSGIPVIGVGINLNQGSMAGEISAKATSVLIERGVRTKPQEAAEAILDRVASLPEPDSWASLAPVWSPRDDTPGKTFRLAGGEEAIAIRIGEQGELICTVDGVERQVFAADAILGKR